MSLFDGMFRSGARGLLMLVHGTERKLCIKVPGIQPFEVAAIWHTPRIEPFINSTHDVEQIERTTADVCTEELTAKGVNGPVREMEIVELVDGKPKPDSEWALNLSTTRWGETLVTLGLERAPLVAIGELRRAQ